MKRKLILTYIFGFISAMGITVFADFAFKAMEVTYTPDNVDWEVNNVQDAISDLKNNSVHTIDINIANQTVTIDTKNANYTRFVALFVPTDTAYEPSEVIHYNGKNTSHILGYNGGNSTVNYPCTNNTSMYGNTAVANDIISGNIWIYGSITNGVVNIKTPTDSKVSKGKLYWWVN